MSANKGKHATAFTEEHERAIRAAPVASKQTELVEETANEFPLALRQQVRDAMHNAWVGGYNERVDEQVASSEEVKTIERLERECEEVVREAYAKRNDIGGAVNWADLHCVDAEYYRSTSGDEGYRVLIEEAAPNERELIAFVIERLFNRGWSNVEVRTEW